jgi:hypothetical protein
VLAIRNGAEVIKTIAQCETDDGGLQVSHFPDAVGCHRSPREGGCMKKQLLSFLAVLGLLVVAGSAFAQSVKVRANIPFSFSLNKETLPAGQYEIHAVEASGNIALAISNREAKVGKMFLTNPVSSRVGTSEKCKLVFKRYGDHYFLSQIWVAGNDTGRELPTSAHEAELALDYTPAKVIVMADAR